MISYISIGIPGNVGQYFAQLDEGRSVPSTDAYFCTTKQELIEFNRGVRDGSIYETYMLLFKAPPNSLHLTGSLAASLLAYFRWFSDRRWKSVATMAGKIGAAFAGNSTSAPGALWEMGKELTVGNSEKLRMAEECIPDAELRDEVTAIFEHRYLLGRVLDNPPTISFYRDDGRF